jgi:hypothetical protein
MERARSLTQQWALQQPWHEQAIPGRLAQRPSVTVGVRACRRPTQMDDLMTTPKRIQQRRTKGWQKPEGAISVARPHKWGNPFVVGDTPGVRTNADAVSFTGCGYPDRRYSSTSAN